jgi:hypothetical protein
MLGILLSINVSVLLSPHFSLADPVGHIQAPKAHSLGVFTSVVVIVCIGALVVTIQAKVSADQRCASDSSRSYITSASRWQDVRSHLSLVGFLF